MSNSDQPGISLGALVGRNLTYYWRSSLAVALAVSVAAAVLVGSLLVGDSLKGTLVELAEERLGRVEHALVAGTFFREQLAADLAGAAGFADRFDLAVPAVMLNGAVENATSGLTVARVSVLGVPDEFWGLGQGGAAKAPDGRSVILNDSLAGDAEAAVGDALLITVGRRGQAPADSLMGRRTREDTVRTMRVTVAAVVPSRGLGAFTLRTDEPRPRNVYVALSWLQQQLGRQGQANAILVSAAPGGRRGGGAGSLQPVLASVVQPADYGLRLVANDALGYLSLESGEFVLPEGVATAAEKAAAQADLWAARVSVYLANSLALVGAREGGRAVPYSIVAAVQPGAGVALPVPFGPGDILLNSWAAEDLRAAVGDTVEMTYYVSSEGGWLDTRTRRFKLAGIVPLEGAATDPGLVPAFEGVTDAETMGDWDPPFPVDLDLIGPRDEDYWQLYRAAPKAYVSMEAARSFWLPPDSADGAWVTSVRLASAEAVDLQAAGEAFTGRLLALLPPDALGLAFWPVRERALAAAKGSTDFGMLFIGMSMFLVAAAAALAALVLRLNVERRASQTGILVAVGFRSRGASGVLAWEGLVLAAIGVVAGVPLGVGYSWLVIAALRHWWQDAVGGLSFSLHVGAVSMVVGSLAGLAVGVLAVWWGVRVLRRTDVLRLLGGWRALAARPRPAVRKRARIIGIGAIAAALIVLSRALYLVQWWERLRSALPFSLPKSTETLPLAGAFFAGGALLLIGVLALFCAHLQRPARQTAGLMSLHRLAWRSTSRNWLRSLLTVGIIACASFVLVTVAANRTDMSRLDTRDRASGAGGFSLVARSDVPVYVDLDTPEGRRQLGFAPESADVMDGTRVLSFRVKEGDDVSCLNVQRPGEPRVLGVPQEIIERGGFRLTKTAEGSGSDTANPWRLLEQGASDGTGAVPAFADAASAQWILHVGLGDEIEVAGPDGRPVPLKLVGLLANSIFAGEVLVSEGQFERRFGADSGYRYFLIETPAGKEQAVERALRENLGQLGLDVTPTAEVLAGFARVQNTYLSTFQTLGGLGLLLGTFGIVTVLLRGVIERRSELAMMLALGFRRADLIALILVENGLLLCFGIAAGTVTALVAMAPHLASAQADVAWTGLAATLAACLAVGLLACLAASASSVRSGLLSVLRSE